MPRVILLPVMEYVDPNLAAWLPAPSTVNWIEVCILCVMFANAGVADPNNAILSIICFFMISDK